MFKNNILVSRLITYLPPAVLFIVTLLIVFFYTYPSAMAIYPKYQQIKELSDRNKVLNDKKNEISQVDTKDLNELEKKAEIAVPSEKTFAGLLSGLDSLSKEAGSTLLTFSSSPGLISSQSGQTNSTSTLTEQTLPSGLKYLEASIGLDSNPSGLISLGNKLADSGRLVTLENISYTTSGQKGANTSIGLRTYFLPKPKADILTQKIGPISSDERSLISKVDSLNRFDLSVPTKFEVNPNPFGDNLKLPVQVQSPRQASSSPSPRI